MARRCYSETPIDGDQAILDGSEACEPRRG
jgi:hypothetical protein